jgi:hypothetical protein
MESAKCAVNPKPDSHHRLGRPEECRQDGKNNFSIEILENELGILKDKLTCLSKTKIY